MKEARYLVRISHAGVYKPPHHADLLAKVRDLVVPIKGKAINLRVSPAAIEFDVFCSPELDSSLLKASLKPLGTLLTFKRLDVPPPVVMAQKEVDEARRLFNEHRFWEVHEVLEGLWKELQGSEKQLVQGLILAAAALVHAQKDEDVVMWKMLADALKRLEGQPAVYYGWDITNFRRVFMQQLASKRLKIPTV